MNDRNDFGLLLSPSLKLQRNHFNEMVKLLGIYTKYQYPKVKDYTTQGELEAKYSEPIKVGVIFQDNIDQKTSNKLGWNAELDEQASIIHVPYDLENLQIGCLFEVPSAFENAPGRLFRVTKLSSIQIYPASITCELVPEYKTEVEKADVEMFANTNFNLLREVD